MGVATRTRHAQSPLSHAVGEGVRGKGNSLAFLYSLLDGAFSILRWRKARGAVGSISETL